MPRLSLDLLERSSLCHAGFKSLALAVFIFALFKLRVVTTVALIESLQEKVHPGLGKAESPGRVSLAALIKIIATARRRRRIVSSRSARLHSFGLRAGIEIIIVCDLLVIGTASSARRSVDPQAALRTLLLPRLRDEMDFCHPRR
jgi:hypothetical protein